MPRAPSASPLKGAPQAPDLIPPRRVKTWGTASWGSRIPVKANFDLLSSEPEHTRPDSCTDQYGRPRWVPAHRYSETVHTNVSLLCIYRCVPPTHEYGTRPFFKVSTYLYSSERTLSDPFIYPPLLVTWTPVAHSISILLFVGQRSVFESHGSLLAHFSISHIYQIYMICKRKKVCSNIFKWAEVDFFVHSLIVIHTWCVRK